MGQLRPDPQLAMLLAHWLCECAVQLALVICRGILEAGELIECASNSFGTNPACRCQHIPAISGPCSCSCMQ
jgi:hypothetical protein